MRVINRHLIHHVVAVWDECDHVSPKHSSRLATDFWAGYLAAFPEARGSAESPGMVATRSPIFGMDKVQSFVHGGALVPHTGWYKDLAIVKFCSTGFVDQDDRFHFILDDLRELRFANGDPPMHANAGATVVLITSDNASGMTQALDWALSKTSAHRTNFTCLRLDKSISQGSDRVARAGYLLGQELKKMFVRVESGALLFDLVNRPIK